MLSHYGKQFSDKWVVINPETMKRDWARKLAELTPEQITVGINLLDQCKYPPSLPEFVLLCRTKVNINACHTLLLNKPPLTEQEMARGFAALQEAKKIIGQDFSINKKGEV